MRASLEQDSAKVGSIVELCLKYRLPPGAHLPLEPKIRGIEGLTILDRQVGPGQIRIKFLVDRLGLWTTGALSIDYLDRDGETKVLTAEPVSLEVISRLESKSGNAELMPIQGIMPTKSLWLRWISWSALGAVILLIIFFLFWWYKKRRTEESSIVPQVPPHVRAEQDIQELDAQRLFEKGQIKLFYFRFSEILRRYLGSLRGFPAVELTTEEIARRIEKEQDRTILALLRQADLVKFADRVPAPAKKEQEIKTALSYIRESSQHLETDQEPDVVFRGTKQ